MRQKEGGIMIIHIGFEVSKDSAISREWIETDGKGGYASSTLENLHTRKYHGLYVANIQKPEGRYVLLSKLEDSLFIGGKEYFLSSHLYPGVIFPADEQPLVEFTFDHFPGFLYRIGNTIVKKSILLPDGKDALLIRYDVERCPKDGLFRLKPLIAFRNYHELSHENNHLQKEVTLVENGFRISPYEGMPAIEFQTSRLSQFVPSGVWYKHFQYTEELHRGFDWEEDLYLPGFIEIPVERKSTVILSVFIDKPLKNPPAVWQTETIRRGRERTVDKKNTAGLEGKDKELYLALLQDSRRFLITTPSGKPAIIAGYPWYGSWGRDTLISLSGLCFHTGKLTEGIAILNEISRHEKDGFLPNFFSANGEPAAYNAVDSSLWYFWTVQELLRVTADKGLIRENFWPIMKRIIGSFIEGTIFETGIDPSGLLHAGNETTALTWMDAVVDNKPVTSRHGYPVELNALWYNALYFSRDLAAQFSEKDPFDFDLVERLRSAFQETFWSSDDNCLGDVFCEGVLDRSIRPNQIFAVSLPFSPLDEDKQKAVLKAVRENLLTPFGLRTLSPSAPEYRGNYRGGPYERDRAYHQGTVWPWLLGAFGQAAIRTAEDKEEEKKNLRQLLRILLGEHLSEAGIGSVSEVFDGDYPHNPGGCVAQACSVAELTRLYSLLKENG
jgi:predicted glycogen debranching enzyme